MKNTVGDSEKGAKLSSDDKKKLEEAVDEVTSWLDDHQEADEEEYQAKQKELESIANPIIKKIYGSGGAPGGDAGGGAGGESDDFEDEL